MGQHKVPGGSLNKRPNQENTRRRWHEPLLCLVCHGPMAKFHRDRKDKHTYRLAKTVVRLTQKTKGTPRLYCHETPCVREFVQNWSKYALKHKGLDALGRGLEIHE